MTQEWAGYAGDVAKSTGIGAVLAGAGGALLVFGMRRFGRAWWAPAAAVVIALRRAHDLRDPGRARPAVQPLHAAARRVPRARACSSSRSAAGVDVGQVYEMDASRRTTAANAYVTGIGRTKRVVLYDNLLKDFSPDEVRLVVAHELGHVHHRDVPHGLLFLAIVAPFGMLAAARLGERFAPRGALGTAAAVPAVVLAVGLMVPGHHRDLQPALARRRAARGPVLARADGRAGELHRLPAATSPSRTSPTRTHPSSPHFLLGTHPTTMERIGLALRFER